MSLCYVLWRDSGLLPHDYVEIRNKYGNEYLILEAFVEYKKEQIDGKK